MYTRGYVYFVEIFEEYQLIKWVPLLLLRSYAGLMDYTQICTHNQIQVQVSVGRHKVICRGLYGSSPLVFDEGINT